MELIERQGSERQRDFANALDAALTQGYGHWALTVADVDQEFKFLVSKGATVVSAPAAAVQPGSRFAYVKDPEGNLIELIQLP
jgi:catechol 2,3-dioxygenase-like lactoylglutathione lyase family enzyme